MGLLDEIYGLFKILLMMLDLFIHAIWYRFKVEKNISTENEEDIRGKVILVTGGSTGIGKASAREFAKRGAIVVIGDVNLKEGSKTVEEIQQETGNDNVSLRHLDLSDMDSVVEFAKNVAKNYPKIKILFNNAGLGGAPNHTKKTKDGFNQHMAVNHLGHFLLTNLLLDNLKKGNKVQIANKLDMDDLMMDKSGFGLLNGLPYANTKYCNALFTKELGKRLEHTTIKTYALCPSVVDTTILDSGPKFSSFVLRSFLGVIGGSVERAVSQFILYCALDKTIENETGKVYRFRKHFALANRRLPDELAKKLWEKSAHLVKLEERLNEMKSL